MTDADRIAKLEADVARLETLVGELAHVAVCEGKLTLNQARGFGSDHDRELVSRTQCPADRGGL